MRRTCALALSLLSMVTASTLGARADLASPPIATCESLTSLALPNITITMAVPHTSGLFTMPSGEKVTMLPFCRVAGSIKPSKDSDIRFEMWMPVSARWNGKLQGIGNGGFAGSINFVALRTMAAMGYAAVSTDTGHTGGVLDAAWAPGHPEKVIDYGYRAIHETTVAAKAILAAFHGNQPRRAYFASCSNGGRQALMEAQRYPEDYDGIIAGAPANDWTHLLTSAIWDLQVQSNPKARIPASKLTAIESATLAACDAADGVSDGIIDNPASCKVDPLALQCKNEETDACLTATQVEGLRMFYSGPRNGDLKIVYPGHPPGGATGEGGWGLWILGSPAGTPSSLGAQFGLGFFRNMVFERADWNANTFLVDRDMKIADDKLAATLNAVDPDLSRFARRGGKLIVYHGWSDAAISATSSIDYFNSVTATMGAAAADMMRLYLVPGMQHCAGGPGPDSFGADVPSSLDGSHNMNVALQAWVEQGTRPGPIVAAKYSPTPPPPGQMPAAVRTRPLCPYPQVAKWKGTGSTDDAANFTCAAR